MQSNARKPKLTITWRNFQNLGKIPTCVIRALTLSGLGQLIDRGDIVSLSITFIKELQQKFEACNSTTQVLSVYDKAKRETAMLEERLDLLSQAIFSPAFDFVEVRNKYKETFEVSSNDYVTTTIDGEVSSFRLFGYHDPKCYVHLYRIVRDVINQVNYLDYEEQLSILTSLETYILTLAHVYDDLECDELVEQLEDEAFSSMVMEDLEPTDEVEQLLYLLQEDLEMDRPPEYVKQFKMYCQTARNLMYYDFKNLHISTASSGTYGCKGKSRFTIPSFVSGAFEPDPFLDDEIVKNFDQRVGFPRNLYPTEEELPQILEACGLDSIDSHKITTMFIPQHKLKRRCIHMAINPIQDRLAIFRHALKPSAEMHLRSDSAADQNIGRQRARGLSERAAGEEIFVHCADISDATGTNSVKFQEDVLSIVLGDREYGKVFTFLTQQERYAKMRSGDRVYRAKRGQPQGTEPSFDGLTLMHYVVFLMVMIKLGLRHMKPQDFFLITGDDSVFWLHPTMPEWWHNGHDDLLFATYRRICAGIGWDVHPSKGYHFNPYTDSACTVEFCKQAYLNGRMKSPMPLELFGQLDTDAGVYAMSLWRHRKSAWGQISLDDFYAEIMACGVDITPIQGTYIHLAAVAGNDIGGNAFADVIPTESQKEEAQPLLTWFRSYSLVKSMDRLLTWSRIPNRDAKESLGSPEYFMSKDMKTLEDNLIMSPICNRGTKYSLFLDENYEIIETLRDTCHVTDFDGATFAALLKGEDDRLAIIRFMRYMEFSKYDGSWYEEVPSKVILDAVTALQHLQPYSASRRTKATGALVAEPPSDFVDSFQSRSVPLDFRVTGGLKFLTRG